MSKMIQAKGHCFIRNSEIVSIREYGDDGAECKITTKHGKTYIIKKSAEELAIELEFQDEAIPAYPGFSVLYKADESNDMKDFHKIPVVGWIKFRRLKKKGRAAAWYYWSMPIVAMSNTSNEYVANEFNAMPLVLPDGRTIDTNRDLREYDSVEKYVKEHDTERECNPSLNSKNDDEG
jgi:hypothetical protein